MKDIVVRGAREHNLKNISVTLPREKFIVITGLSGSGKSTLAFDTIYAEGQRRYVESLSAYARQFLGLMNKPDIDSIDGLSPAISIEQKTTSKNPRSTVGTVTEIYDYLRLLFARVGKAHCPKCDTPIQPQSAENITNLLLAQNKELIITAPLIRSVKGTHEKVFEKIKEQGFARMRVDGVIHRTEEAPKLERYEKHWIEAVIDRVKPEDRSRMTEAVEQALNEGKGTMIVVDAKAKQGGKEIERAKNEQVYSSYGACPKHQEVVFEPLEPRMFSFNSPFGACQTCLGLGEHIEVSEEKLLDEEKTIIDGAIKVYGAMDLKWRANQIADAGRRHGFDIFTAIKDFTKKQRQVLLRGEGEWEGIIPQTMRLYHDTESNRRKERYEKYMVSRECSTCKGRRLKDTVLSVTIQGKSIIDITDMNIENSQRFFKELKLTEKELVIATQVLKEINDRLGFLYNVGLGYLNLSRSARTLSGGEAQRIRLATQIGSNLMGVLYILDEPSIGLHQRDNEKLIQTLHRLRDLGNTLIVVEHDEDTIRASDYVVDMGPGAGIHGGHITAQGTPKELMKAKSITGEYLSGKRSISIPKKTRKPKEWITIRGASENNLKNITAKLPTGVVCAITGVSGSGKSTLMNQTVIPALDKHFGKDPKQIGKYKDVNIPKLDNCIVIDQDPIGRTPRSNPATYTKLFDDIRTLYASTKDAKAKGFKPGRFSFNVKGGRCETCQGDGTIKIEMNFLPDVYVECEDCKGKRYNKETLSITYKGKNIADILNMSVEEALETFQNHSNIRRKLETLSAVGLDYIKLGQSATTFSGGESQRIKLTRELAKQKRGNTVYLLDEPTTGLHFEDVKKLLEVLQRLVNKGNTIYVIEHNLDVIKSSDYIVDLGPEGGDGGGKIVAQGTPQEVAKTKTHTGSFLKKML